MGIKKYSVKDSLGYWITLLARTIEKDFEDRIKTYKVTRVGYVVLNSIENENYSTPADIASYLGVDRAAVTRHLDRLEDSGLIVRSKSYQDKRSLQIKLTNQARKILASLIKESQNTNKKILKKINKKEAEDLLKVIKKTLDTDYLPPKKL